MSDGTDAPAEHAEFFRQRALLQRKPAGPAATGRCAYCDAPVAPGLRWCDSLCREDHEAEEAAKKRSGR